MRTAILSFLLFATFGAGAAASNGSWAIDQETSSVGFTVTKFGREVVEGRFGDFEGVVVYDPRMPELSTLRWRVRAASVSTGDAERDRVLRGPEFFHVARFPELTFQSERIRPLPDGRIHIRGAITIRGERRPLVVTARLAGQEAGSPVFESRFVLNRHDFKVSGGSVSRHGISDDVVVRLRLVGVQR